MFLYVLQYLLEMIVHSSIDSHAIFINNNHLFLSYFSSSVMTLYMHILQCTKYCRLKGKLHNGICGNLQRKLAVLLGPYTGGNFLDCTMICYFQTWFHSVSCSKTVHI